MLLAEERTALACLGAGAIAQTGVAIGAVADPAASVQVALAGGAGGMATGVVLGANVAAGAIGVTAAGIGSFVTAPLAALAIVGTLKVLAAGALGEIVAIAVDAAFLARGAAGVVFRAIFARTVAAELFAIAIAIAAGAVATH